MTTIAWDGKTLAGDRLIVSGHTCVGETTKVHKLVQAGYGDCWVGFTGPTVCQDGFLEYLRTEGQADAPKGDYNAIVIHPTARKAYRYYWHDSGMGSFEISYDEPAATGSGEDFALTAMLCGKTAEQAIEMAIRLDIYTGGGIDILREDPFKDDIPF